MMAKKRAGANLTPGQTALARCRWCGALLAVSDTAGVALYLCGSKFDSHGPGWVQGERCEAEAARRWRR